MLTSCRPRLNIIREISHRIRRLYFTENEPRAQRIIYLRNIVYRLIDLLNNK